MILITGTKTVNNILLDIRDTLTANGWTANKDVATGNGRELNVNKGSTYVNLKSYYNERPQTLDLGSESWLGYGLAACLSTGFDTGDAWDQQVGALETRTDDFYSFHTAMDLGVGSFNFWIFHYDADNTLYCVIENGTQYGMIGFGELDVKGQTLGGGQFVVGSANVGRLDGERYGPLHQDSTDQPFEAEGQNMCVYLSSYETSNTGYAYMKDNSETYPVGQAFTNCWGPFNWANEVEPEQQGAASHSGVANMVPNLVSQVDNTISQNLQFEDLRLSQIQAYEKSILFPVQMWAGSPAIDHARARFLGEYPGVWVGVVDQFTPGIQYTDGGSNYRTFPFATTTSPTPNGIKNNQNGGWIFEV